VKREAQCKRIKGIVLPGALEQQNIAQFADDTSLSLAAEEDTVLATRDTLSRFCTASGLLINEEKSIAYYWDPANTPRPS
jgi:hypothetical protein